LTVVCDATTTTTAAPTYSFVRCDVYSCNFAGDLLDSNVIVRIPTGTPTPSIFSSLRWYFATPFDNKAYYLTSTSVSGPSYAATLVNDPQLSRSSACFQGGIAPTTTTTSTTTTTTTTTTAAPAGTFTVKNTSGSGQIDNVVSFGGVAFYFTSTGNFPLTYGQQLDGGGASLTGADIFVDISSNFAVSCLSLYINGALSGQLEVSGNGTYTFTNKTITSSDVVLIEYVSGTCA
jgi:hypothetical protein